MADGGCGTINDGADAEQRGRRTDCPVRIRQARRRAGESPHSLRATLAGHSDWVRAVPGTEVDGRPVAVTGGADSAVRVWDLADGTLRAIMTGHTRSVLAVACTEEEGPVVVTAGHDETVPISDLAAQTGEILFRQHASRAVSTGPGREIVIKRGWDLAIHHHVE